MPSDARPTIGTTGNRANDHRLAQPNQIFTDTLNVPGGIQPADMIAGNPQCRRFIAVVAVLVVLLTLLLFFAWSRKRDSPKPEPPLHTAGTSARHGRSTDWQFSAFQN